jgi:hypothetical protein
VGSTGPARTLVVHDGHDHLTLNKSFLVFSVLSMPLLFALVDRGVLCEPLPEDYSFARGVDFLAKASAD